MGSFRGYKRQIKLEFDFQEVKDGIPNVKKQMAVLNAEFRKSKDEARASGKEIDHLGVKYDYLSNKLKIQQQEVEAYRDKLEKARNAQGNNTKAVENATASLEIAQAKLGQTQAQLDKVTQELEKQKTTLGKTSEEWKELSEKTSQLGKDMTMKLTVPILAAGAASFKLGADFEDAMGKADTVFGDNAREIEQWSKTALKEFGLSRVTALSMVTDFAAGFNQLGIDVQKSTEWSKNLTSLVNDMSTFYNATTEETQQALTAILSGQTEPLKKFQIFMTQANLQQFAYSKGIRKSIKDMTEAEKVQLRYNYVIEKTTQAHGNFKKEQDSATAQLTLFKESLKELGVSFSEKILPVFTPMLKNINKMIEKFANLDDGTKKFIVTTAGIIAISGPIIRTLGKTFEAISNISEGMKTAKKVLGTVSKAGKLFSGALDTTKFFGFAKWAIIIAGVAAAIGFLIKQINVLIGKGQQANASFPSIGNLAGAVRNTGVRGYAVGTNYIVQDQVAVVHKGEAIVPAESNPYNPNATRYDGNSGNQTVNVYVQADDLQQMADVVRLFDDLRQTKRAGA